MSDFKDRAPDGGWGWMVVAGAGLGHFFASGIHRSFTVLYELMLERFGGSATATAWVMSLHSSVKMFGSPLVSMMCSRFGHRAVVMTAGVVCCVGMIASGFVPTLQLLYLTICIEAFGMVMHNLPAFAMIGQYFDKKRARASAVATTCNAVGAMVLGPLIQFLATEYGYSGTFLIIGACVLNFCVTGALFRPLKQVHSDTVQSNITPGFRKSDSITIAPQSTETAHTSVESCESKDNEGIGPVKQGSKCITCCTVVSDKLGIWLLKDSHFLTFCFLLGCMYMATDICTTFMTISARENGLESNDIIILLVVSNAMDIPFRLLSGLIFDIPLVRNHQRLAFATASLLTGLVALVIPLFKNFAGIISIWCVYMALRSIINCQNTVVTAKIVGRKHLTTALGLSRLFQGVGMFVGPLCGGLLRDVTESYSGAFYLAGSVFSFMSIIAITQDIFCLKNTRQDPSLQLSQNSC